MLLVVRILGLLVAVALGYCVLAWMFSGERKWLRYAWQIFRYSLFATVLLLVLFAAEALLRG